MTNEEAIKHLEPIVNHDAYADSFQDACKLAIKALEKQIPKKVKKMEYELLKKEGWNYACPVCGGAVGINQNAFDYTETDDFCSGCGQAIDWSEEE